MPKLCSRKDFALQALHFVLFSYSLRYYQMAGRAGALMVKTNAALNPRVQIGIV